MPLSHGVSSSPCRNRHTSVRSGSNMPTALLVKCESQVPAGSARCPQGAPVPEVPGSGHRRHRRPRNLSKRTDSRGTGHPHHYLRERVGKYVFKKPNTTEGREAVSGWSWRAGAPETLIFSLLPFFAFLSFQMSTPHFGRKQKLHKPHCGLSYGSHPQPPPPPNHRQYWPSRQLISRFLPSVAAGPVSESALPAP